jgi:hypothetical protein
VSVENSPYYDEVDVILGDKQKTDPVLIMDSLNGRKSTIQPTPPVQSYCTYIRVPGTILWDQA